jgi:hypothetical protein
LLLTALGFRRDRAGRLFRRSMPMRDVKWSRRARRPVGTCRLGRGAFEALERFSFSCSVRTCRIVGAASRAAGIGRRPPGGRAGTAVLRSVRSRCRGDQGALPATSVSRQHHWGFAYATDHGAGDRRDEDLRPAVVAIMPGRAVTGGHGRRPPHARATGRGGAGRPPPSEHADLMKAGRRARRWFRVDSGHRDPCRGD